MRILRTLDELEGFSALICDVWGVLHEGGDVYAFANNALMRFREQGGRVLLCSNAPRPSSIVLPTLLSRGLSFESYDDLLTSGDLTYDAMTHAVHGRHVFFIGTRKEKETIARWAQGSVEMSDSLERSDFVLVTGFFDGDAQNLSAYQDLLHDMLKQDLLLVCANPDIKVPLGGSIFYCAGAIAKMYEDLGGRVVYYGKPYHPIYDEAWRRLSALAPTLTRSHVLAIGDGLKTDIEGAKNFGCKCVFIAGGLAQDASIFERGGDLQEEKLHAFLKDQDHAPDYCMSKLA